jgi:hypothetical protein
LGVGLRVADKVIAKFLLRESPYFILKMNIFLSENEDGTSSCPILLSIHDEIASLTLPPDYVIAQSFKMLQAGSLVRNDDRRD